jgi:hypothetical protein
MADYVDHQAVGNQLAAVEIAAKLAAMKSVGLLLGTEDVPG